ncbi:MAG: nickel-binding protein [Dehalococcoidia bacterium]
MPLYMDVHGNMRGAKPEEVSDAHLIDLAVQERYGVQYHTYWFNEPGGKIYCLMTAPNVEAAVAVHREAHGLLADEIIEVEMGAVESFMHLDPAMFPNAQRLRDDPTAFDGGFRTVMFTDMERSTPLTQRLGDAGAMDYMRRHNSILRECLHVHGGNEIKHTGDGVMASFVSVSRAVESAIAIQRAFEVHNAEAPREVIRVRVGLSAGEPVGEGEDLFGASVIVARRICDHGQPGQILISNVVRELCLGKSFVFEDQGDVALKGFDQPFRIHEVRWKEPTGASF